MPRTEFLLIVTYYVPNLLLHSFKVRIRAETLEHAIAEAYRDHPLAHQVESFYAPPSTVFMREARQ